MNDTHDIADRIIFHIDVNSAFLSWSAVKRLREDPSALDLRTVPSAVGGNVETRHGIITAKSIPAKKYGVTTGEPVISALKKCPNLILVPNDRKTYKAYSADFIRILRKYADEVEQVSIDEAFLDMSDPERFYEGVRKTYALTDKSEFRTSGDKTYPLSAAELIKNEIRDTLGFTVNVGISTNKILAKMASDFEKPDKIHTLYPDEIATKLWPLPIGELFGCGRKTAEKLKSVGVTTIGDAATMSLENLQSIIGSKAGEYLHNNANGISDSPVISEREKAKSYSNETTTAEDITAANYQANGLPIIQRLSESVASRLRRDNVRAYTVYVIVKTGEFRRHTRQTTLPDSTNDTDVIRDTAAALMDAILFGREGLFSKDQTVRLIGVGCTNIDESEYVQMDLFSWAKTVKADEERKREEEARLEAEKAERQRLEEARLEAEKAERQRLEEARLEAEKAERQRLEEARLEAEKAERQRLEEARLEAERAERQRLEEVRLEAEKAEREKKKMLERDRQQTAKKQRLDEMLAKVRKKYGDNAIHKGSES